MSNRVRPRRRRRRCIAATCYLLLLLILCIHHVPISADADVFERKADEESDEDGDAAADDNAPTRESETATENRNKPKPERSTAKIEPAKAGTPPKREQPKTQPIAKNASGEARRSPPTRPPSIVEAEARTARELARTARGLAADLRTCEARVDAIEEGFQNLYSAHLSGVDGLRKCREGVLVARDDLDDGLDDVDGLEEVVGNPALLGRARAEEDRRRRSRRDEEIASKHRAVINGLEDRVESLIRRERSWERTISELQARRDLLEKREGAWERTIGDLMGEIEIRARRESWWEEMKREMEGRIGTLSHIAVVERFGPGPHYVSMTLLLDESNPSSLRTLVFQLAPLELMPHSIHLFLAQIAEGYWSRGTPAIVLNAEHVLQACPHPCLDGADLGGNVPGYPYEDMRGAGLDVVSFQEYSPEFPHARYTIGYAGRPHSGPEFYVNLLDNTLDHGTLEERKRRMGPAEYEAWAEGAFGSVEEAAAWDEKGMMEPYPCFGKLIVGFDVVDEIAKGMTRASLLPRGEEYSEDEGQKEEEEEEEKEEDVEEQLELDENMLLRPIKIASMTILENYSPEPETSAASGGGKEKEKEGGSTTSDEL